MTIHLLVSNEQLGRSLHHHLSYFGQILPLDRTKLNLTDTQALTKTFKSYLDAPTSVELVSQIINIVPQQYTEGIFTNGLYHLTTAGKARLAQFEEILK